MTSGSILDMDHVFDIAHGSTVIPDDVGAVAVIDGSKLVFESTYPRTHLT